MAQYPNLRAEMTRYGVTQSMIAEHLGKSDATVVNWFAGKYSIPISACFSIRDRFFEGLSVDYLFSDKPTNVGQ